MDLSRLKWPVIILVVVGVAWLLSSGGINFMVNHYTKAVPGQDMAKDKSDEAGLSRLGGFQLMLFRYENAAAIIQVAMDRYGTAGANYWNNLYRMAKAYDRMGQYQASYNVLQQLIAANASQYDKRVPENSNLTLRASKLKEVHELR
jgi:tetratricopeptide (TPR) repeat protein